MKIPLTIASGDPALYLMMAGILVLAGGAIALGLTGIILLFGKTDEKKKLGKKLLIAMTIPVVSAAAWWVVVVGFD
jgi:hypothetical protein